MIIKILLLCIINLINGRDWDFVDFEKWKQLYPECGMSAQSPIDIPSNLQSNCDINDDLQLKWDIKKRMTTFIVENQGYSLKASSGRFINDSMVEYYTSNTDAIGNLTNTYYGRYGEDAYYCLDSLHFHWGSNNTLGPEHTLNGEMGVLELHFVHYSCQYKNIGEALNAYTSDSTGKNNRILGVVGVIFDIGEPNEAIEAMIPDDLIYGNMTTKEVSLDITDLIPFKHNFIGYYGSLTTPPCFETVFWHVMTQKMTVSQAQLDKFRAITNNNWRPIQPLNNRPLYICSSDLNLNNTDNGGNNGNNDKESKKEMTYLIIMVVFGGIALLLVIWIIIIKCCTSKGQNDQKNTVQSQENAERTPMHGGVVA